MRYLKDWRIALILALTIGLAPYVPEPHIVGKVRWIIGGAEGMQFMDWLDFALHGFPWLLLLYSIWMLRLRRRTKRDEDRSNV